MVRSATRSPEPGVCAAIFAHGRGFPPLGGARCIPAVGRARQESRNLIKAGTAGWPANASAPDQAKVTSAQMEAPLATKAVAAQKSPAARGRATDTGSFFQPVTMGRRRLSFSHRP